MKFEKGPDGNWYNTTNNFYIGTSVELSTGESFYQHLYDSGDMTLVDIIDNVMNAVNISMEDNRGIRFKKGYGGDWHNTVSGYHLGDQVSEGTGVYQSVLDAGNITLREIIDDVMLFVNDSIRLENAS